MRFDGTEPETCERCGFDSRRWRRRDAADVLSALGYWWRLATSGSSPDELNRRPAAGVWSALEYGLHTAMVLAILRDGLATMLASDRAEVHDPFSGVDTEDATRPLTLEPPTILGDLEREGAALGQLAGSRHGGWRHLGRMEGGSWWQAEATLFHAVHDTTHHFLDVGEGLSRIGAAVPRAEGTVEAVHVSDGGVPKRPVGAASVTYGGLEGDRQADHRHHGRPFQAVCLFSSEAVAELAGQGHAIAPGAAGENLTLSGLDWRTLRPGTRITAGAALLELSYPATPCKKQARWFTDGDVGRLDHDAHPEWARWYAWVRRPGEVRAGDPAVVSPA